MKKIILAVSIITIVLLSSCSTNSSNPPAATTQQGVTQSLITGWWYRGANAPIYKAYYFGADGTYKQDGSNFGLGMGIGTWSWETATKIKVVAVSGMVGGGYLEFSKLTQDSLVSISPNLKLSRTNHN